MSLATASAGGAGPGAGALSAAAMAHGGPSGMTLHQHAQPPPGAGAHHHFGGAAAGVPAPGNLAALGADLVDKSQRGLGLKAVRNVASLPLAAVDLYGEGGEVAYFPPVLRESEDDDDDGGGEGGENPALVEESGPLEVKVIGKIGPMGTDLVIKTDDDAAHKAVRRLLTKGTGYDRVFSDALSEGREGGGGGTAKIARPHLLLGARRTSAIHPSAMERYIVAPEGDSSAIAEDAARAADVGPVSVKNGTLDGSSATKGDDYDRASFHLAMHSKKKSLTMLPEEAVGILIAKSKKLVDGSWSASARSASDADQDDEEAYTEVPAAIAVPGWANLDSVAEALLDAASGNGAGAALYQRSIAAMAGALLPNAGSGHHKFLQLLGKRINDERKARQQRAAAGNDDDGPTGEYLPTVVMAGMTSDGIELTVFQLGRMQDMNEVDGLAPFGDFKVQTTVCYQSSDPLSMAKKAMKELVEETDALLPELFDEDGGPVAAITYGTIPHQLKLKEKLESILKAYKAKGVRGWDDSIPFLSTREECVASGTALLAGVSHGRVYTVESDGGGGKSSKKHRARPGVVVQNASCCAVGVRCNYFGGEKGKWLPVKTVFDFDRRVPAGPYQIDLSAAEAVVQREVGGADELEEDKLLEKAKRLGGAKNIPKREEAALAMRLQVVQRTERGGEWIPVGDPMRPLTMMKGDDDENDNNDDAGKKEVACESSVLELSLNPVGLITSSLVSDGQSVVQATKSARNSALRYYLGIFAAIAFFGGFLVKSYVEEHIFERDTQRLLAYYKRAAPNSLHDGDLQGARYLVWKYKGKKAKLWRRLEAKYGMPVRHAHEWDDDDDTVEEEEEQQNLDEEGKAEEKKDGDEPDL